MSVLRAVLLLLLSGVPALAQAPRVNTLRDSGAPADRIDLVVLSEGYAASERQQFFADARFVTNGVWEHPLFGRYAGCFNVHAVFTPAVDAEGELATELSAFRTRFTRPKSTIVRADWPRVQRAALLAPDVDRILVLCNTEANVGSRSGNVIFASHVDPVDTVLHELGHTLANLADEYVKRGRWTLAEALADLRRDPRPNVAPLADLEGLPWRHWIDGAPRVALPGSRGVGVWEGAYYLARGIARPRKAYCRMRYMRNHRFCEPCREALVHAIYREVHPVEFSRAVTSEADVLRIETAVPAAARTVRWSASAGAGTVEALLERASRGNALEVRIPRALVKRTFTVEISVADETPWVREGRDRLRWTQRYTLGPRASGLQQFVEGR